MEYPAHSGAQIGNRVGLDAENVAHPGGQHRRDTGDGDDAVADDGQCVLNTGDSLAWLKQVIATLVAPAPAP